MAQWIRILSIDGGGIRGIIPATVLAEMEKRTGKPISKLFHLIAGTSTGGILALGMTMPGADGNPHFSAEDGVRLYENEGPRIFPQSVWQRMRSVVEEQYPAAPIEAVLDEYFGETRLKDALTNVFITSYEIERRAPWFFRSYRAKEDPAYDFPMKQVARSTSAAPTYFEPARIDTEGLSDYWALIDGGVFANNPAMCAFVDAKRLYPEATRFLLVSLGTGEANRRIAYNAAKGWGLAGWAQPVLNIVFQGVSATVDYQLRQLLPEMEGKQCYYRFQARLDDNTDDMDNTTPDNMRALKLAAEALINEHDRALDGLCKFLVEDTSE
jgi:uncharacterized protein